MAPFLSCVSVSFFTRRSRRSHKRNVELLLWVNTSLLLFSGFEAIAALKPSWVRLQQTSVTLCSLSPLVWKNDFIVYIYVYIVKI